MAENYHNQPTDYEVSSKRGRSSGFYIFIGLGVLALLGVGSCFWMFVDMFQASDELSEPSQDIVSRIDRKGFLSIDDPLLSSKVEWTDAGLKQLQFYADLVGPIEEVGTPVCNATRKSHTIELSGYFVVCAVPVIYPETPGTTTVTWIKEAEAWKLVGYFISLDVDPRTLEENEPTKPKITKDRED